MDQYWLHGFVILAEFFAVRRLRTLQQTLGASADGDEFKPGNQRFATRLCGLYRRPRLRDFAVWLDWAAVGAPNRSARDEEALREFSGADGGGLSAASPGEGAAWLAATDGAAAGGGEAAALEAAEALRAAAAAGSAAVVAALVRVGADVDGLVSRRERGVTPLMAAAQGGHVEAVSLLLASQQPPPANAANGAGWTPLMLAILSGAPSDRRVHCVKGLLSSGASIAPTAQGGWNALLCAAQRGDHACLAALIESCHGALSTSPELLELVARPTLRAIEEVVKEALVKSKPGRTRPPLRAAGDHHEEPQGASQALLALLLAGVALAQRRRQSRTCTVGVLL